MTASDDARQAIAANMLADFGGLAGAVAQKSLAATMPGGRTIAQHLDDGAAAEAEVRRLRAEVAQLDAADVDPDTLKSQREALAYKSDYLTDGKTVPLANRMAVAAIGAANAAPDVEVQALRAGLLAIATTLRPEITDEDRRRMQDNLSRAARTTHEHGVPAR